MSIMSNRPDYANLSITTDAASASVPEALQVMPPVTFPEPLEFKPTALSLAEMEAVRSYWGTLTPPPPRLDAGVNGQNRVLNVYADESRPRCMTVQLERDATAEDLRQAYNLLTGCVRFGTIAAGQFLPPL